MINNCNLLCWKEENYQEWIWCTSLPYVLCVSSYDATACQGKSIWEKDYMQWHVCVFDPLCLLRHVFSICMSSPVSLTTVTPYKWPLSTVTETAGLGVGVRRGVCDRRWPFLVRCQRRKILPEIVTSTLRQGLSKVVGIAPLLLGNTIKGLFFSLFCIILNWATEVCNEFKTLGFGFLVFIVHSVDS